MKYSEVVRILKKHKCIFVKPGSRHDIWYSPITKQHFPVPRHGSTEATPGTIKSISNLSGVKL